MKTDTITLPINEAAELILSQKCDYDKAIREDDNVVFIKYTQVCECGAEMDRERIKRHLKSEDIEFFLSPLSAVSGATLPLYIVLGFKCKHCKNRKGAIHKKDLT